MKKMLAVTALVLMLVVALAAFTPGQPDISWNSGYAAWSGGYASWSSGGPLGPNFNWTTSVNWGGGGGGGGGGG
jgi:hypothetical protein